MTRELEQLLKAVLLEALEYYRSLNEEMRRERYEEQRNEALRRKGYNVGRPRRRWGREF
jgi:hypothetical protein